MKKAFLLLILFLQIDILAGELEQKVSKAILENTEKYHIDPKIFYTLIDVESAFHPYAICVETNRKSAERLKALQSDNIKIIIGRTYHSRVWMVSIFPNSKSDAVLMSKTLKAMGYVYDAGIMQINSCNFSKKEAGKMFDVEYNIAKGAKIFKSCTKQFKEFKHQVECYNRGAGNLRKSLRKGKHYYPYYRQFRKKWDF